MERNLPGYTVERKGKLPPGEPGVTNCARQLGLASSNTSSNTRFESECKTGLGQCHDINENQMEHDMLLELHI